MPPSQRWGKRTTQGQAVETEKRETIYLRDRQGRIQKVLDEKGRRERGEEGWEGKFIEVEERRIRG